MGGGGCFSNVVARSLDMLSNSCGTEHFVSSCSRWLAHKAHWTRSRPSSRLHSPNHLSLVVSQQPAALYVDMRAAVVWACALALHCLRQSGVGGSCQPATSGRRTPLWSLTCRCVAAERLSSGCNSGSHISQSCFTVQACWRLYLIDKSEMDFVLITSSPGRRCVANCFSFHPVHHFSNLFLWMTLVKVTSSGLSRSRASLWIQEKQFSAVSSLIRHLLFLLFMCHRCG